MHNQRFPSTYDPVVGNRRRALLAPAFNASGLKPFRRWSINAKSNGRVRLSATLIRKSNVDSFKSFMKEEAVKA
jgi:hypothetical protein